MAAWKELGSAQRTRRTAAPGADAQLGAPPSDTVPGEVTRSMVLWCPDWPIAAVVAAGRSTVGDPVALIDRGVVFACSDSARTFGVARGIRVREAQARCTTLTVLPYDPALDVRGFEPVLAAIEQAMPGVQAIRPGLCVLRVRGAARFYGGERAAAAALVLLAREAGVPWPRVGVADGPFAAEQAARRGGDGSDVAIVPTGRAAEFLAPLPVEVFGDAAFADLLRRLGLRSVGDLVRLGRHDLRSRFGAQGLRAHALASGEDAARVLPRTPSVDFERWVEFEPGLERVDQVTFGFRAAADDFHAALLAAKLVCTSVTVEVRSESGAVSERTWLHPRWFTAGDVIDRVRWQLQGTHPATSGLDSPVVRVSVRPEAIDALGNHEAGLWGGGPDERVHHGLSRVQSMLGHEAVVVPSIGGGRLLADRQIFVPWGDRSEGNGGASHGSRGGGAGSAGRFTGGTAAHGRPVERPTWPGSLPSPVPSTVFAPRRSVDLCDAAGLDVTVDDRGEISAMPAWLTPPGVASSLEVTAWAGPWPVHERWWDAATARRVDRVHIVDSSGTAWLVMLEDGRWWAEARYD